MVAPTIFFSWQSDTPRKTGRNLIDRALEMAISELRADLNIEEAVRDGLAADSDTKGVPGSPPIVDTIFRKIEAAAVFVPDLTFAGTRIDGRPTPNANVCIEYGWALKCLTHSRIVPVMNVAHGLPSADNMPFDLRHLRNPISFNCPPDATEEQRRDIRKALAKDLAKAIALVLKGVALEAPVEIRPPFVPRQTAMSQGRFCNADVPIGIESRIETLSAPRQVFIESNPVSWLRVMPVYRLGAPLLHNKLRQTATNSGLLATLWHPTGDYGTFRREDGFGVFFASSANNNVTPTATTLFETGEVWGIDAFLTGSEGRAAIPHVEEDFCSALDDYVSRLRALNIEGPYKWIAGIEGLRGKGIYPPSKAGVSRTGFPMGQFTADVVMDEGVFEYGARAVDVLKPFFVKLYDRCGLERGDWMDELIQS